MQRDLSYAQAIGSRAASRQAAAAGAAAGAAASDRSGPADVPKLTFTIDGYPMSPTTTIFQAVEVQLPPANDGIIKAS